jgi:hypothetical protein
MNAALKGTLVAAAVAGLFGCSGKKDATEATAQPVTTDTVQCVGVNECKGQGACGAADGSHSCAGKNECKGKGWVKVAAADCTAKGGTYGK